MEVSGARLALYLVQLIGIVLDAIGWDRQAVPDAWAIPALVILCASLFLTIYADNQNEKEINRIRSEFRGLAKQVAFLMKSHKRRRQPPT